MGTRFFAWYDVVLESYPAQAGTDKVVLLPQEDDTFAVVVEGDMVLTEDAGRAVWRWCRCGRSRKRSATR